MEKDMLSSVVKFDVEFMEGVVNWKCCGRNVKVLVKCGVYDEVIPINVMCYSYMFILKDLDLLSGLKPLCRRGIPENVRIGITYVLKRRNLILGCRCWNLLSVLNACFARGNFVSTCLLNLSLLSKMTPRILQSWE